MSPARAALDRAVSALQDALTLDVAPAARARLVACLRELARAEGAVEWGEEQDLADRVARLEGRLDALVAHLEEAVGELPPDTS